MYLPCGKILHQASRNGSRKRQWSCGAAPKGIHRPASGSVGKIVWIKGRWRLKRIDINLGSKASLDCAKEPSRIRPEPGQPKPLLNERRMTQAHAASMHGIRDNHSRGSVAEFLKHRISEGISFISGSFGLRGSTALTLWPSPKPGCERAIGFAGNRLHGAAAQRRRRKRGGSLLTRAEGRRA